MSERAQPAVILDDGGLPSLVACLLEPDPGVVTSWWPGGATPVELNRRKVIERKLDLLGLSGLESGKIAAGMPKGAGSALQADATWMFLEAAAFAQSHGCSRIVWPCCFDADLEQIGRAASKAMLLSRLIELDAPATGDGSSFTIETPLIDLTDHQLADLAKDLDAPLGACWWCLKDAEHPCGQCDSCRRWQPLLSPVSTRIPARETADQS